MTEKRGDPKTMRAIAVTPGTPNSVHLRDVRRPVVGDIADGRGVLVDVVRVGLCGTDRDIVAAEYGQAPPGQDFLILGHENLGRVAAVGDNVPPAIAVGSWVVSTVRRPGQSVYDRVGRQDLTLDDEPRERGLNLLHGFLSESYVEDATYVVPLPAVLSRVGVLLEPTSVVEKGIGQAFAIQRRLPVWRPERALVIGAGTIGLLATLVLRLRGLVVTLYSRRERPYLNSELGEAIGAAYESSSVRPIGDVARDHGPFDLIFEASTYSPLAWQAAEVLGRNGVLVLASVTGGTTTAQIPSDALNLGFVIGNKVMVGTVNAAREDFERGVDDLVLAESLHPRWLERLLTTPIRGLEQARTVLAELDDPNAIKAFVDVDEASVSRSNGASGEG